MHEIIEDLGRANIFSSIDFKTGYWQILLSQEFTKYTAFTTPSGEEYQFRPMLQGKNSSQTITLEHCVLRERKDVTFRDARRYVL